MASMRLMVAVLLTVTLVSCRDHKKQKPVVPDVAPSIPSAQSKEQECLPGGKQTGQGCDMEGIRAEVRKLLGKGGPVQGCYYRWVTPPRPGRLVVKFWLSPDGRAHDLAVTTNELASDGLAACVVAALKTIPYPPPGDVPCQVVYPFVFGR